MDIVTVPRNEKNFSRFLEDLDDAQVDKDEVVREICKRMGCTLDFTDFFQYLTILVSKNMINNNRTGSGLLEMACSMSNLRLAKIVIEAGVNPGCNQYHHHLHVAAANGNIEMVRLLIAHGANINFHDPNEFCSFMDEAVKRGDQQMVEYIWNTYSSELRPKMPDQLSSLEWAAAYGKVDMVRMLLNWGFDPNRIKTGLEDHSVDWQVSSFGPTAFVMAFSSLGNTTGKPYRTNSSSPKIVAALIRAGFNVDLPMKMDSGLHWNNDCTWQFCVTTLQYALAKECPYAIYILLSAGTTTRDLITLLDTHFYEKDKYSEHIFEELVYYCHNPMSLKTIARKIVRQSLPHGYLENIRQNIIPIGLFPYLDYHEFNDLMPQQSNVSCC